MKQDLRTQTQAKKHVAGKSVAKNSAEQKSVSQNFAEQNSMNEDSANQQTAAQQNPAAQSADDSPVLEVKNLSVSFYTDNRKNNAIRDVSFQARRGKTLCIVGESGCGKSVSASAVIRLLPELSRIEQGEIIYHGRGYPLHIEKLNPDGEVIRKIRGAEIAMIFQDPMTALNPVYTVGFQISEMLLQHTEGMSKKEAMERTIELLRAMGIPSPEQRVNEYPHEFSGGMRQRAMIAMAMACNPQILLADEPTTALDVTVQAQIFELMEELKRDYDAAIVLITHDMGVVTELADDVSVMYMGYVVEEGTVDEVLRYPAHPYTKALLASIPRLGRGKNQELKPIRGSTPDPFDRPPGCQFEPRCDYATAACRQAMPDRSFVSGEHYVRCFHSDQVLKSHEAEASERAEASGAGAQEQAAATPQGAASSNDKGGLR